eukprot:jgi/Psemu1/17819/gm1.17819_g
MVKTLLSKTLGAKDLQVTKQMLTKLFQEFHQFITETDAHMDYSMATLGDQTGTKMSAITDYVKCL